jgi:hypothetical protein
MKIRGIFSTVVLMLFACSYAHAVDGSRAANRTVTLYDTKNKCQVVCKAPKPALEILEDGLAYLLDIPLAILSPITCPIVSPILDRLDPVEERSFPRRKR